MYCLENVQWMKGDSGGPVYYVNGEGPATAAGLIKGTVAAKTTDGQELRLGCFSNIEDTLAAFGPGFEVENV